MVDPAVLPLVVRAGAGSVRDSLSVLDQLLAGAGPDGLTAAHAAALLGLSDVAVLDDAVEALAAKAPAGAFSVVEQVMATGHDPRRFAMDLLERVRDLLVLQTVPDAPDRGLLAEYAPDQIERMRSQAGRMGASELSRAADLLHTGLVEMRDTISPRLMLELVLARVLLPGASADPAALQVRLERLERQFAAGVRRSARRPPAPPARTRPQPSATRQQQPRRPATAAAPGCPLRTPAHRRHQAAAEPAAEPWPETATPGRPAARPRRPPAPAANPLPVRQASAAADPAAGEPSLASVIPAWPDLLASIAAGASSGFRTAGALLAQGQPVAVRGTELVLAFTPGNARNFQKSGTAETLLREALNDRFGGSWKITRRPPVARQRCRSSSRRMSPRRARRQPDRRASRISVGDGERARAPTIRSPSAMEALGAQIVDERETG